MKTFFKKLFKRGDFMTRADKWYYSKVIKTWLWSAFAFVIIAWVGTNLVLCALSTNVKSGGDVIYEAARPAILPAGEELAIKIKDQTKDWNESDYTIKTITFDYYTDETEKIIAGVEPETIDIDFGIYLYRLNGGEDVLILSKNKMYANQDSSYALSYFVALETIKFNNFNTSLVEDMTYMFAPEHFAFTLKNFIGIEKWDTSNVKNMEGLFAGHLVLETLDLSGWDTRNVTNMGSMFSHCEILQTIYTSEKFVTTNVANSKEMFDGCSKLQGGKGTKYSSSHTDKTYARIDGGPSSATPGYFTAK